MLFIELAKRAYTRDEQGRFADSGGSGTSRPPVEWVDTQLGFDRNDYVTSRATATRRWVPVKGLEVNAPHPRDRDLDDAGALPPASLLQTPKGLTVMDGNHRIDYWRRRGFTHIPAIVYTEP